MSCLPTYKGKRYNSLEELKSSVITPQQKQEAQSKFQEYINTTGRQDIKGFKEFVRGAMIKKLNKQARVRLEAMGINTKELSQESIKVINGLQEANKLAKIKKTSEIESLINKANGKDQDYKKKPC